MLIVNLLMLHLAAFVCREHHRTIALFADRDID
jgi:hypothetical protein